MLNFAKENRISEVYYLTEDSDDEEIVRDLLAFEVSHNNELVPFVSERVLYDLIGKDDARTFLALVSRLTNRIAPKFG